MRTLVIDTATQALSLALFEDDRLLGAQHEIVGRGHAEALIPAIAALPDGGRAARIAVDVGPGSFTGVRIGIAAARALALAWGASLVGYGAIDLIAAQAAAQGADRPFAVAITGGHGELFWQAFGDNSDISTMASIPIARIVEDMDHGAVFGTGAQALDVAGWRGDASILYPDARHYPLIAGLPPLGPQPIYGRGADARPMAAGAGA